MLSAVVQSWDASSHAAQGSAPEEEVAELRGGEGPRGGEGVKGDVGHRGHPAAVQQGAVPAGSTADSAALWVTKDRLSVLHQALSAGNCRP
jgi:hypothetical protein